MASIENGRFRTHSSDDSGVMGLRNRCNAGAVGAGGRLVGLAGTTPRQDHSIARAGDGGFQSVWGIAQN